MHLSRYKSVLEQAGVHFTSGLTLMEVNSIETAFHFRFPPDLRAFLMFALPVSNGFLNWRDSSSQDVQRSLLWPYEGICFDIEHNAFWLEAWGPRPETLEAAFVVAKHAIAQAPTLIPILGHRYMPDRPYEVNNPVFSVYQTDIIYYGRDLVDYLENEFRHAFGRSGEPLDTRVKPIEFWSDLAS